MTLRLKCRAPSKDPQKKEKQVAPRQIKMPGKDGSDKEAEEVVSQRERPERGRYLLQVDKQTKGSYKTPQGRSIGGVRDQNSISDRSSFDL